MLFIHFFYLSKRLDFLMDEIQNKRFSFLYNGGKINIKDTTPIIDYFHELPCPRVIVIDNGVLSGDYLKGSYKTNESISN